MPNELGLTRNVDIVAEIANQYPDLYCVGFAAETDNLLDKARDKLERKKLDLIAANLVNLPDRGIGSDDNALVLVDNNGNKELPLQPKPRLARELINEIAERYHAKNTTKNSRQANR